MIWRPGTSPFLFRKPGAGGGSSVPVPTVYWEADSGIVTTTNGTTADASPVSGNKVLSWTSKDASASVASFGTNSQRPTYYNFGAGKPFVRFDGQQNQRLSSSGPAATFNNAQAFTMGVAFRAAPIYAPGYRNQQYLTLDNGSANTNTLISQGGGMQFGFWSGNIGQRVLLNNSQQLWGETTYFGTFSTASSTSTPGTQSTKIYTGGTLAASNTTSTAGVSPCVSILIGGADPTSGVSTICDYYGVYLYASELNATQISAVHNDISSRIFTWSTLPVSGAAVWLDSSRPLSLWDTTALGANVYANGGAIGQWNDLSGNARHAQQSSSANRPTWLNPPNGISGMGATSFNGSSQFLSLANTSTWGLIYSGDFTINLIHKVSSTAGGVLLGQDNGSGVVPKWMFGYGSNGVVGAGNLGFHYNGGGFNGFVRVAWTPTAGQTYRITATRSGNDHYFFVNGTQVGTTQTTASRPGNPSVAATIGQAENAFYLSGSIAETVIHQSYLDATQQLNMASYLTGKWGV